MVQGGVDGVEMTHFLHPHDQEGLSEVKPLGPSPEKVTDLPKGISWRLRIASYYEGAL